MGSRVLHRLAVVRREGEDTPVLLSVEDACALEKAGIRTAQVEIMTTVGEMSV
jgi:hypothetical protein